MTAEVFYLPRVEPEPTPNTHWLLFDPARQIKGCACGFPADVEADCGFGDSVVDHLLEVGANAAR